MSVESAEHPLILDLKEDKASYLACLFRVMEKVGRAEEYSEREDDLLLLRRLGESILSM